MPLLPVCVACGGEATEADRAERFSAFCKQISSCPGIVSAEMCEAGIVQEYEDQKARGCADEFDSFVTCVGASVVQCRPEGGGSIPEQCQAVEQALETCQGTSGDDAQCSGMSSGAGAGDSPQFCAGGCSTSTQSAGASCERQQQGYSCSCSSGAQSGVTFSIDDCDQLLDIVLATCG